MTQNIGGFDGLGTHENRRNSMHTPKLAKYKINDYKFSLNKKIIKCFKLYHDMKYNTKLDILKKMVVTNLPNFFIILTN